MDNQTSETSRSDDVAFPFDLFLSYSTAVRFTRIGGKRIDIVKELKRTLERHIHPKVDDGRRKFRVCTDEEDFALGDNVRSAIRTQLTKSRSLLVLCSDTAAKSQYVMFELQCFSEL